MKRLWYRFRCWQRFYCPKHDCYKRSGYGGGSFCPACGKDAQIQAAARDVQFARWAQENKPK